MGPRSRSPSRRKGRSDRPADHRARRRATLPRPAPPARAAALPTGRARECPAGGGSRRVPPVRSARDRRSKPRPRAASAHRRLPARVDRPMAVRGSGVVRDLQQDAVDRADGRAAVVPADLGPQPRRSRGRRRSTNTRRSSRSSWRGSATTGRCSPDDVGPRAAIDWYWRPTNQVRAILEALGEAGIIGIARRERQPSRLRPRRTALPRRAAGARGFPNVSNGCTDCCPAIGRAACWGWVDRANCGTARGAT